MGYWEAIILGIVQGLTEFLPVSSSGHLVILEHFMDLQADSPKMILFDLMVHLGTMVAILVYYRRSVTKYCTHLAGSLGQLTNPVQAFQRSASIRFSVLAVVAVGVTGVIFKLLGDKIEAGFGSAKVVGICWLITAVVLMLTDRRKHSRRSLRNFGIGCALAVGLAQGMAMFPGISRSGSTICAAVLLGLHRRWAGEFSFLIGVPAIAGAALLKGMEFFHDPHAELPWGPTLVGSLVSAVVGLAALALLIWAVRRAKLKFFAVYCAIIGVATLVAVAMGKI